VENKLMIQKGFKATDKDGKCKGYQYSLPTQNEDGTWTPGEWHEHDGELNLCYSGFHWCLYPSGPWSYYSEPGTRIWNIEADQTAEQPKTPGADYKLVSKRIRLVSEVVISGNENTGNENTGNSNTGYGNTGHWNTGHWNTGHWNTGNWNATDRCSGVFCVKPQTIKSFDVQTGLTLEEYIEKYPMARQLGEALLRSEVIPFEPYKDLPGITKAKLKALHVKHLKVREAIG
jgi:hypothetical protein